MHALSDVRLPTNETAVSAESALRSLQEQLPASQEQVPLRVDSSSTTVVVPRVAIDLFMRVLAELANGNAVTIVPVHAELTTQQAADLLNVSRPYLVKVLDEGKIPFTRVGNRRRVLFSDLL